MFDYKELKLRILRYFENQKAFAEAVGRTSSYVSNVLNNKALLSAQEIDKWVEVLEIPAEEIGFYFFAKVVAE